MLPVLQSTINDISPYASWRQDLPLGYAAAPAPHRPFDLSKLKTADSFIFGGGPVWIPGTAGILVPRHISPPYPWLEWGEPFHALEPDLTVGGVPRIKIVFEQVLVGSCEEANRALAKRRKEKRLHGGVALSTVVSTQVDIDANESFEKFDDEFRCTLDDIALKIDLAKSSIIFPELIWHPISEREQRALGQFYVDLMVHELGHFWIAGMIFKHGQRSFEGWGKSKSIAKSDAGKLVNTAINDMKDTLRDVQGKYDAKGVTDHGATQSKGPDFSFNVKENGKAKAIQFPGGRDVDLDC